VGIKHEGMRKTLGSGNTSLTSGRQRACRWRRPCSRQRRLRPRAARFRLIHTAGRCTCKLHQFGNRTRLHRDVRATQALLGVLLLALQAAFALRVLAVCRASKPSIISQVLSLAQEQPGLL
jgi:hypothetical protein